MNKFLLVQNPKSKIQNRTGFDFDFDNSKAAKVKAALLFSETDNSVFRAYPFSYGNAGF